ncbi:hypothetical protein FORMB_19250 [Formosa sp. Hel1_33_131]|nr:hypothetical protein FORMB_19250 [Formosa sp. Hel1_33_131]
MGYGTLISIYYQDKKYKTAAIWALMFLCVIYLMIETYIKGYSLDFI